MFEKVYNNFAPETSFSMQRQITMFLRNAIHTGKLKAGNKLPSSRKLAENWGTNYFTVNSALKPLVQEGILLQKPRVGTIVRKRTPKLEKVGIYFTGRGNYNRESYFYLVLQNKIQNELTEHGGQCMLFFDERKEEEMRGPMVELQQAISDGKIDCLIAPLVNGTVMKWLDTLSIPRVALSANDTPFSVCLDTKYSCRLVVKRFKELNASKIGIITCCRGDYNSDGSLSFLGLFKKLSAEYDLECRNEWCIAESIEHDSHMEFGYTAFKKLFSLREKPDGLLLFPSIVAMGAINSIMEQGVKIPEEMKIIIHQNTSQEIFTPFTADKLVTNPEEVAQILLDKLIRDTAGQQEMECMIYKNKLIKNY